MDVTLAFILITLAIFWISWLVFDLWVVITKPPGIHTITHEIQETSVKSIAFPALSMLLLGLILGHLFLQF